MTVGSKTANMQHWFLVFVFIYFNTLVSAQKANRLFDSSDPIAFTLFSNMKSLFKDKGDDRKQHPVMINTNDINGKPVSIYLKAKTRGNFRRTSLSCKFAPLMLNFEKKCDYDCVFDGQDKLKLVSHCKKNEYILREYLVYKIYNLVTDFSFKARFAKVTYVDSLNNYKPVIHDCILIEDENEMTTRLNSKNLANARVNAQAIDTMIMASLSMFQYMIGNTDWSVPFQHNIKVIRTSAKYPLAVPYDFDHAGIVGASYAFPNASLPIKSTKQRLYRGPAYSDKVLQKVVQKFNDLKADIYALYEHPELDAEYKTETIKFLDEFYATINNEKSLKSEFQNTSNKKNN